MKRKYFTIPQCLSSADRKIDRNLGYVRVYCPMHPAANTWGYVYEHRLVAEQLLGRLLVEGECVHHKNGVRWDNRPDNLEVLLNSEHSKLPKGVIGVDGSNLQGPELCLKKQEERNCDCCGNLYMATKSNQRFCSRSCCYCYHRGRERKNIKRECLNCGVEYSEKRSKSNFCSLLCANKFRASVKPILICPVCGQEFLKIRGKIYCSVACANKCRSKCKNRPSKSELEKLIWEMPFTKIALIYDVSDRAVKKWAEKYGIISFPGRGYWR